MQTQSIVATQHGQIYMKKLCRHWGHRCEVELSDTSAVVKLPFGQCRIEVDRESMKVDMNVSDSSYVTKAENFFSSHLIRMANKDNPEVNWFRDADATSVV